VSDIIGVAYNSALPFPQKTGYSPIALGYADRFGYF
jgi:hypothetical protein